MNYDSLDFGTRPKIIENTLEQYVPKIGFIEKLLAGILYK